MLHYDNPNSNPEFMQAAINQFESEIYELKTRLKTQESETQKANSKFEFSVSEQENLKRSLKPRETPGLMKRLFCSTGLNKRRLLLQKHPPSYPA